MKRDVFFSEVVKDDNSKLVFKALKKAGMLIYDKRAGDKDRNDTTRPFPESGKTERCICLTMPDADVVEEVVETKTTRFVFDEPEDAIFPNYEEVA